MYPVIADPPLLAGAVKDTVALPLPATAETLVGAPVTDIAVRGSESADVSDEPAEFAALTVKVYAVPRVRPVIVSGDDEPDTVMEPGIAVTV